VLRRKIGAPSAGTKYWAQFDEMCERELPGDYLVRHELGPFFVRKSGLLLHELFCEIFLTGRGANPAELSMRDFIAERAGKALTISA
jgi:asparagine synthase (glutamine-hydrolysing)